MKRQYNYTHKERAMNLRREATRHEKKLWYDMLCAMTPRFHRQYMIGNYIVDFYCPELKLVIELDGSQHDEEAAIEYDRKRKEYLEEKGMRVLRYWNIDIDRNFKGVCEEIYRIVAGAEAPEGIGSRS